MRPLYPLHSIIIINSVDIEEGPVPDDMKDIVRTKRHELIETVANVDDELGEMFLSDQTPSPDELMVMHQCMHFIIMYSLRYLIIRY